MDSGNADEQQVLLPFVCTIVSQNMFLFSLARR